MSPPPDRRATSMSRERRRDGGRSHPLERARPGRSVGAALSVAVLIALLVGVAGTVGAFDRVAIVSPEQTHVEAAPGDEFEIDLVLQSQGGHGDEGIEAVTLVTQYHPDYLEVTDVERGSWLEGDDTTVRADETIAHDDGTAISEQWRDPAADGATGVGTVVTLTVRVAEDAPAATTTLSFEETTADLTADWPIAVVAEDVTVAIDGGDEPADSFDHPDPETVLESSESAATADANDSDGSSGNDGANGDGGDDGGIPISGGTIAPVAVGVALLLALVLLGDRFR